MIVVCYGDGDLGKLIHEINQMVGYESIICNSENMRSANPKDIGLVCIATQPYSRSAKFLSERGYSRIYPCWMWVTYRYRYLDLRNGWEWDGYNLHVSGVKGKLLGESRRQYLSFLDFRNERTNLMDYEEVISNDTLFHHKKKPSTLEDVFRRKKIQYFYKNNGRIWDFHSEGMELPSLHVNMQRIKELRPKISVACYHSNDGLAGIQNYLMAELDNYQFYFRCYAYMAQAAYFYAIPNECHIFGNIDKYMAQATPFL